MEIKEKKIENEFYTLQKNENGYFIKTEYVKDYLMDFIENSLENAESNENNIQKFYDDIKNFLTQYGNKNYSFSPDLSDSFVNKEFSFNDYLSVIKNFINTSLNKNDEINYAEIKIKVIKYLKNKKDIINYFLNFEKLKERTDILVLSNRIGGWSNPKFQLSKDFSIEVKSNFGFGRASYFFLSIYYKNVNIAKFSDWIYYRFAKFYEVSRYTKKYHHIGEKNKKIIHYESWNEIIKLCNDIINLIENDLEAFIDIYIIQECKTLIDGLEYIIQNDTFDFFDIYSEENLNELPDFKRVNLKGEELILFRTEKILGALDFITEINILSELTEMSKFISKIEEMNKKFFPIADAEFKIITPIYFSKKEEFEAYDAQYIKYIKDSHQIIDSLKNKINKSTDNLQIEKINQQIEKLKLEMSEECSKHITIHNNLNHLRIVYEHFSNYIEKFNKYFQM